MEYTCVGNVDQKISHLNKEIQKIDEILDGTDLNEMEQARLEALNNELHHWKMRKAQILRQCSRKDALGTTKIFHFSASWRNKQNNINMLKSGDTILSSVTTIRT